MTKLLRHMPHLKIVGYAFKLVRRTTSAASISVSTETASERIIPVHAISDMRPALYKDKPATLIFLNDRTEFAVLQRADDIQVHPDQEVTVHLNIDTKKAESDLDKLLKIARERYEALTPVEKEMLHEKQRESYVRGEMGWPKDCPYR